MKLYLDPGHGGTDTGATGNGLQEKDVVLDIALRIRDLLLGNYDNVTVRMSRTEDTAKSLAQRTNEANAWDADYFLSIHCNAFNSSSDGYEDFIHSTLSDNSQTARYRDILHAEIIKLNGLRNRGKKKANFHVLRESSMPAMLTENGFIDHSGNAALMKQDAWKQRVAEGHVNGLAQAFSLQEKNGTGQLYKVIAGSFKSKENAGKRVSFLSSKSIQAFVEQVTISDENWYRVQAGAFKSRKNAENHLQVVRNTGIDAFIIVQ
ncbi:N-acetylmuramoyl-L-alanine amidase [Oceanobacillus sp. FSL K6-2867]|uniref:N-acetylmuramoyl-L-alanine amidase n=1 Tax=Oceanobacillus sp. FSL K6-2867 TaxID=2954748 RepID=UPI0030DAF3D1